MLQGSSVSVSYRHISRLHWYKFLVGLKVIVFRQDSCTYKFFLKNCYEIKKVFWRIISNVIYFVWRNRKTVLTILFFWSMLHNTNYTFYYVINESKVAFAIAIVENLYSFAIY